METKERPGRKRGSADGQSGRSSESGRDHLAKVSLVVLGVVFGDIATSPLYAIRECFLGEFGIPVTPQNILGILSLMFWALTLIVGFKYLLFVFRADNAGEGGVIALTALLKQSASGPGTGRRRSIVILGLFGACLLYGDGMITPAISVLSAVEGIRIITPIFEPYVIPLTALILGCLFLVQHRGTARVGALFGPVVLVWLSVLAVLGSLQIAGEPQILAALLPWHGVTFLMQGGFQGFVVLGAVFLVVTGTEALYADMGHFGKRPIRLTWMVLVFPALVLNYFGQGALLLSRPEEVHHPFYALVPSWGIIPMVVLATLATIIASQAVITGAFSLTRQAIQLGYLPRLRIVHTSGSYEGQIYLASVNWLLMFCTIGLVVGLQSSSKLAAAYGLAVTSTMTITTVLFYFVARSKWRWGRTKAGTLTALFLIADLSFFSANLSKIMHGAWFPLLIGGIFFTAMLTWERGRSIVSAQLSKMTPPIEDFQRELGGENLHRVPGEAVFLCGNPDLVPAALVGTVKHHKALASRIVLLHFQTENLPRIPNFEKVEMEKPADGLYRIIAHYGFLEDLNVRNVLALAEEKGLELDIDSVTFILGRERLFLGRQPRMARWRSHLFLFLSRNASDAASFFHVPLEQAIEIGVPIEI